MTPPSAQPRDAYFSGTKCSIYVGHGTDKRGRFYGTHDICGGDGGGKALCNGEADDP